MSPTSGHETGDRPRGRRWQCTRISAIGGPKSWENFGEERVHLPLGEGTSEWMGGKDGSAQGEHQEGIVGERAQGTSDSGAGAK